MSKRIVTVALMFALAVVLAPASAAASDTWTGEVIDKACFEKQGAHGPDHVDCAKRCFENGGDVGLLTADGEVVLLKAHGEHGEVFDAVKALAGAQATVTGEMMEDEEGHQYVVVTSVEATAT